MLNSKKGLLIIYVFLFIGCNSNKIKIPNAADSKNDSIFLDDNLVNLFLGIEIIGDSSSIASEIITSLNCSRYEEAVRLLMLNYSGDTVHHSGFWGLQSASKLDNICSYLFFRYENFLNNLPQEQQERMIASSLIHESPIINNLQELEYLYVKNLNDHDSLSATHIVLQARRLIDGSKKRLRRVEFLLANSLFDMGDIDGGLILFNKLIQENYYALPSFKKILGTLSNASDSVKLEHYMHKFKDRFPDGCLIQQISYKSSTKDILTAIQILNSKNNQRDLILARTMLARHYLHNKNYQAVDSIIDTYFRNFAELTADDFLVKYQRGVFFDLRMRRYYIKKEFDSICDYALISLRDNPVIEIKSEEQFKNYIRFLYKSYTNKQLDKFENFFNSHFEDCR